MSLIKELTAFIKQPKLKTPVALSFKQSVLLILKCIAFYFVFILICTILFIPLSFLDIIPEMPERQLSDSIWIILYAPVLEELFFRLPLRSFFKNVFITLALLFYALFKTHLGIPFTIAIALFIVVLPYIPKLISQYENDVNSITERYFPWFFYFIVLSFGFMHITNFKNLTMETYLVSPVIVLFQLLMGFLLGFVRVNYKWGIVYSIIVHAGFNSIPVIIKLL